jgi:hypothetical protein
MFAPPAAKAQTKAAARPPRKEAPAHSTQIARPSRGGTVEQGHRLQRSMGNQAMLRLLGQGAKNLTRNEPDDHNKQEAGPARLNARRAGPGLWWDFSKIPIVPPEQPKRLEARSWLGASRLPGIIQAKLVVGEVNDPLEHEADRVANQVMGMAEATAPARPTPTAIQMKCAGCEEEDRKKGAMQHLAVRTAQSVEGGEEDNTLGGQMTIFRKAAIAAHSPTAPEPASSTTGGLARRKAGGESLSAATLHRMENAFGRDFSRVRVHCDAEAGEMSRQLSALAFTHGNHIFFGSGKYDPEGAHGKRLLAHELTHVVQQGQAAQQAGSEGDPVTARETAKPAIQRTADWAAGSVHQTNNLANSVLNGPPVGVTIPKINGTIVGDGGAVRAALAKPTVSFSAVAPPAPAPPAPAPPAPGPPAPAPPAPAPKPPTPAPQAPTPAPPAPAPPAPAPPAPAPPAPAPAPPAPAPPVPAPGATVNAKVATVPANTGSFDETVLAAGPWTLAVPKATVGAEISSLTQCTGAGNSTFHAIGDPSDAHMFAANRRHEDHHAADFHDAFIGKIVPWDAKLTAAKAAGTAFNGPTQAAAEAALHAAMGGTPDQVADAFTNTCAGAIAAFHATPAGGPVQAPTGATASADCSTSSAKYHNPS